MDKQLADQISINEINPSNKINKLYREAITTGNAPGNYCKVQILGDERVGKTSLRKNLMGEEFDPEQASTVGIDTRMCNVKDVDEHWQERKDGGGEFDDILRWFCAKTFWKEGEEDGKTQSRFEKIISNAISVLLLIILSIFVFTMSYIVDIPIGRSLCMAAWISCLTLLITKDVKRLT